MNRRKVDLVFSSFFILISLVVLTSKTLVEGGVETELGSLFLPRIVAVLIIVFSMTIGIQSLVKLYRKSPLEQLEYINTTGFFGVGLYFAIFITYWFIVPYVGFLIATPLAMLGIAVLLGCRRWITFSVVSIITTVFIFYGCRMYLRVFLPTWSIS